MNIKDINFIGREPSKKEGFYTLMPYIIDNVDKVRVNTSATTRTEFSEYDFDVVFLFQSPDPNIHNYLFNQEKPIKIGEVSSTSYEWLIRKLKSVSNHKIIKMKLYEFTDIKYSSLLARYYNADLIFDPFINITKKIENIKLVPTSKKLAETYTLVNDFNRIFDINIKVNDPTFLFTNYEGHKELEDYSGYGNIDPSCKTTLYISSEGNIYPNEYQKDVLLGNLLKLDVDKLYENRDNYNKEILARPFGNKCGNCIYRNYCGGSLVNSWFDKNVRNNDNCGIPRLIKPEDLLQELKN